LICPKSCFAVVEAEAKHVRHGAILASQLYFLSRNIFFQIYASKLAHLRMDSGVLAFIPSDAGFFICISVLVNLNNLPYQNSFRVSGVGSYRGSAQQGSYRRIEF